MTHVNRTSLGAGHQSLLIPSHALATPKMKPGSLGGLPEEAATPGLAAGQLEVWAR